MVIAVMVASHMRWRQMTGWSLVVRGWCRLAQRGWFCVGLGLALHYTGKLPHVKVCGILS